MYRLILLMLFSSYIHADGTSSVWKGEYYQPMPINKVVSKQYCEAHSPGTFTHVVKEALNHPIYTDKGIKLSKAQFMVDKVDNIYLIHGSFLVSGQGKKGTWNEKLHYFLFKKTEYGTTQGVWYTSDCKGLYRGQLVRK